MNLKKCRNFELYVESTDFGRKTKIFNLGNLKRRLKLGIWSSQHLLLHFLKFWYLYSKFKNLRYMLIYTHYKLKTFYGRHCTHQIIHYSHLLFPFIIPKIFFVNGTLWSDMYGIFFIEGRLIIPTTYAGIKSEDSAYTIVTIFSNKSSTASK